MSLKLAVSALQSGVTASLTVRSQEIESRLPEFHVFFTRLCQFSAHGSPHRIDFGIATLVSRRHTVTRHMERLVAGAMEETVFVQRKAHIVEVAGLGVFVNFHGLAFPGSKLDTEERLQQCRELRDAVRDFVDSDSPAALVIAGDFNLLPHTQSVAIVGAGLHNLVVEHKIETTRSELNVWHNTPQLQKHADYFFVNDAVLVRSFRVPSTVLVSDHLPMLLDFEAQ